MPSSASTPCTRNFRCTDVYKRQIQDYNALFGTSFDTSADKFQNYYKDLSQRLKKRELDLVIVVNMFLTGFDATTLNTLWADKNLKAHGLIQAYSRTNRILNSVKTYGNICLLYTSLPDPELQCREKQVCRSCKGQAFVWRKPRQADNASSTARRTGAHRRHPRPLRFAGK